MYQDEGNGIGGATVTSEGNEVEGKPSEDVRVRVFTGLYEDGFKVGMDEGRKNPDPKTEERLAAHAETSAKCLTAAPYDHAGNIADSHTEEHRKRLLEEDNDRAEEIEHATAEVRDKDREKASLPQPEQPSGTPYALGSICTAGISATTAPTLHDVFFAKLIPDSVDALTASWVAGVVLAGGIVMSLLSSAKHRVARWAGWIGLAAGIGFGFAFLALRLASATTEQERFVALGLAILEFVALLVVELKAHGIRREWEAYRQDTPALATAEAKLTAAKTYLEGRIAARNECRRQIEAIEQRVARRESLVRSAKVIMEAAKAAVLMGYHHACSATRGNLTRGPVGVPTREEIKERLRRNPIVASFLSGSDDSE